MAEKYELFGNSIYRTRFEQIRRYVSKKFTFDKNSFNQSMK